MTAGSLLGAPGQADQPGAELAPEPAAGRRRGVSAWRRAAPALAAVLAYALLAWLAYWPVSPVSSTRIATCGCGDPAQEAWFLAWPLYALLHGHSLFATNWIEYPGGVNLAANTSMPLLGLLVSPITALFGPVASYNFLLRLSFALSATSAFFVLRRWVRWTLAAFLGGLLYGFSPYMVGEGLGHVFLLFVPLPPLIFLALEELLVRQRRPAWQAGAVLGLLAALQFYISAEVLVTTLLVAAIAVAIVIIARPHQVGSHLRHAFAGLCSAAAVTVLLVGYALWIYLRGPAHIVGPSHAVAGLVPYHADLLSGVIPSQSERIAPSGLWKIGNRLTGYNVTETGAYIGFPLLLLLVVLVVRGYREARIRLAAAMAIVMYVLSMGATLDVYGVDTHIPLPFAILQRTPVVQGAVAGRLALFTGFFLAVVLAVGLDREHSRLASKGRPRGARLALAGIGALCLVPLLPAFPYHSVDTAVPPYFMSSAVDSIPAGSVVLAYPYPDTSNNEAMLWAASAGMRFRIIGGQAAVPGRGGRTTSMPATLRPVAIEALFLYAMLGKVRIEPPPPLDAATLASMREFFADYDVGTVVVDPLGKHPEMVTTYLEAALGAQPELQGGVEVWYDVGRLARTATTSATRWNPGGSTTTPTTVGVSWTSYSYRRGSRTGA